MQQPQTTEVQQTGEEMLADVERSLLRFATWPTRFWRERWRAQFPYVPAAVRDIVFDLLAEATEDHRDPDSGLCPMLFGTNRLTKLAAAMVLQAAQKSGHKRFIQVSKFNPGEHYHVRLDYRHGKFDTLDEARLFIEEHGYIFDGVKETHLPATWR